MISRERDHEGTGVVTHVPPRRDDTGAGPGENLPVEMEMLFLGMEVDRDRTVTRRPSFHYPAPYLPSGRSTRFTLEFRDEKGNVLSCHSLREDCVHCPPDCWPKRIRDEVPYPREARKLMVWDRHDKLYEEDIPDPPKVTVKCQYREKEKVFDLKWDASSGGEDEPDLWYLVHWRDREGTWRGVAPRTKERHMTVPASLVGSQREVPVRILATSGIATGVGTCTLKYPYPPPADGPPDVVLVGEDPTGTLTTSPRHAIEVRVVGPVGGATTGSDVVWFDEQGGELSRGRSLDLRLLPEGQHVVHAVSSTPGGAPGHVSVIVEVGPAGTCLRCEAVPSVFKDRDVHTHKGPHAVPNHPAREPAESPKGEDAE